MTGDRRILGLYLPQFGDYEISCTIEYDYVPDIVFPRTLDIRKERIHI